MSTIHRVGLTIAGVVAFLVVAGAFVVQGYTGAQREAALAASVPPTAVSETPSPTATADVTLDPETIYIAPMPTPPAITAAKPAPPVVSVPQPAPPAVSVPQPTAAQQTAPPPTEPQPTAPAGVVVPTPSGHDDSGGGDD